VKRLEPGQGMAVSVSVSGEPHEQRLSGSDQLAYSARRLSRLAQGSAPFYTKQDVVAGVFQGG